jgi:hypothetical protein
MQRTVNDRLVHFMDQLPLRSIAAQANGHSHDCL